MNLSAIEPMDLQEVSDALEHWEENCNSWNSLTAAFDDHVYQVFDVGNASSDQLALLHEQITTEAGSSDTKEAVILIRLRHK